MFGVVLSSIISFLFPAKRGQTEDCPLPLTAVPGLMTLLDVALFRSVEGQLTATICSSHALLACWLDVKHQAQHVMQLLKQEDDEPRHSPYHDQQQQDKSLYDSLARQCLESACDAIERLGTDRLASGANMSDPYDSTAVASSGVGGHHHHHHHHGHHNSYSHHAMTSGVGVQGIASGILQSKEETGRRQSIQLRRDCWESPRLYCPDHVWADDVYSACQRWTRNLDKHPLVMKDSVDAIATLASSAMSSAGGGKNTKGGGGGGSSSGGLGSTMNNAIHGDSCLSADTVRQAGLLVQLIEDDLPLRLYQFRQAMEAEAVVTKRLYLVKCEYRAPFRAFLEAHQSLLRAPPMKLVDYYLDQHDNKNKDRTGALNDSNDESLEVLKSKLQSLLNAPELVELLVLEMEAETIELEMGDAIFPFSELARSLDHKRARLKVVPGVVDLDDLQVLQETVRRLKFVLCRKGGSETSTGIRPILLDLLLIPRDDEPIKQSVTSKSISSSYSTVSNLEERIGFFLSQLSTLATLVNKSKNAFASGTSSGSTSDIDFPLYVVRGCTEEYDPELLKCQLLDWFAIVDRQHELQATHPDLAEEIRRAEMKMSIAGASPQSLQRVKERLASIQTDREQRLAILQEMVQEVCLREMNLYVQLHGPDPQQMLELRETPSARGFLGIPLDLAGEALPLG